LSQHRSVCRLCGGFCGIVVDIEDGRLVRVAGDADHPDSEGYTCAKGRALPTFLGSPSRLDFPLLHGSRVSWAEVLDDLATSIRDIVERQGPNAIGTYGGTAEIADRAGQWARVKLGGMLGTRQMYSSNTVDIAPIWKASELVMGVARTTCPVWEPERPESPRVCVVIGSNPVVSHGYGGLVPGTNPIVRVRRFRNQGGQLWVLDPRTTETALVADRHLPVLPGSDAVVLAWLVRELLLHGADLEELRDHTDADDVGRLEDAVAPFTIDVAVEHAGVDRETLLELLLAIRSAGKIACITGTGVSFGRRATVTEWLRWALLIVTGSLDRPGGMRFLGSYTSDLASRASWNHAGPDGDDADGPASRPELRSWLGEYPSVAMVDEIKAGSLSGLIIAGGNPLTSMPQPARTRQALSELPMLAVCDVVRNELTGLATHVLPVADMFEHDELMLRERASFIPAVVPRSGERMPQWWVLSQIAQRLGLDLLRGNDPDEMTDAAVLRLIAGDNPAVDTVMAAGVHGLVRERACGWVHERVLPNGRWRIAPRPLVDLLAEMTAPPVPGIRLVSRRLARRVNSVAYSSPRGDGTDADVMINPVDAAEFGLRSGDDVVVASAHGSVTGRARVDDRMRCGSVSVSHGLVDANVSSLIAAATDVDVLSGQPAMSGVAVTVTRFQKMSTPGREDIALAVRPERS
jgi:anaerobic selenocysteine-containing dehydrogenase